MKPRDHDPRGNPCFILEIYNEECKNGNDCWPSFLSPPLNETKHDGKITPDEFDDELNELKFLNQSKLVKLMKDVQQYPIIWK